jgi:hypothetical protein
MAGISGLLGALSGPSGGYASLLDEEELAQAKRSAQADALLNLSSSLFKAGAPSRTPVGMGQALIGGLQGASKSYQDKIGSALQEKMNMQKMQQAMQSQKRAAEVQGLIGGAYRPAQAATQGIMDSPDVVVPPTQATPARFDLQAIAPQLMQTAEGRAALGELMGAQKAMRPEMFSLAEGATQFERDPMTGEVRQVGVGAPKSNLTSDYKNYQSAQVQGFKGSFMDYQTALKRAGVEDKSFSRAIDLRKDFRSEPVYKAQQEMKAAYSQVKAGLDAQSPVGDLAAATKIMKLLDPGSVVRESELGMAMAATGLLDRITNYAQNVVKGTKLTEQQRKDFANLAQSLYSISESEYNKKREEYVGIANRNKLPLEDVVGPAASLPKIQRIGW